MLFSIGILIIAAYIAFRLAPREQAKDVHIHGAGQIGLLAAVALFGVDYFTSYYYATGEMMNALHPYGLQNFGYITAGVIAIANLTFGALYMYSLGPFNEGGGSYTASMRYLWPTISLIVAVTLVEDYILTIVVSALSGGDQLLSIMNLYLNSISASNTSSAKPSLIIFSRTTGTSCGLNKVSLRSFVLWV